MPARKIRIMSGVPGCGKSTYVKQNMKDGDIYLSRDEFRDKLRWLTGCHDYFPVKEADEKTLWAWFINYNIVKYDNDIWIDQTTLTNHSFNILYQRLPLEKEDVILYRINTPVEVCLERNAYRTGYARVPDATIKLMANSYKKFSYDELPEGVEVKEVNYEPEQKEDADI